jgi:hypothetical protein
LLIVLLASGCASRRLLLIENELLRTRNHDLDERLAHIERVSPAPEDYRKTVDLAVVDEFLTRAGYGHTWNTAGQGHIRVEYSGENASFDVTIQHFDSSNVLFLATSGLTYLKEVENVESMVLLLVQVATLNYDLLVGKFQLNPETGEVLLSTEIHVDDGLGYETFTSALEQLISSADERFPELERAAQGTGF